jgi:hypothetical protein
LALPERCRPAVWLKRISATTAAAIVVASLVVLFPRPALAGDPLPGNWQIMNNRFAGNACLVSRQANSFDHVSLTRCDARYVDQQWSFFPDQTDPGYYHLYSKDKNKCLIARNFGADANVAVLGGCGHWSDQEWFIHYRTPNAIFIMQRKLDSQCLKEPEAVFQNWVHVTVGSCATLGVEWFQFG